MKAPPRSVLPPSLTAKLATLASPRWNSDAELKSILAELSGLPANLIVRASNEIALAARLGWQPLTDRMASAFVGEPIYVRDLALMRRSPDYAWLFLFHPNGHVRESALDTIKDPPTSAFFSAALAWRLNDWAKPVRQAAQRCAERILRHTDADVAADVALYLLDRHLVWGRWNEEAKALDQMFERRDVMAGIAAQLRQRATGPMATYLRHALRYQGFDEHLPGLAVAAVQPSVRALAYRCLISGKAAWPAGYEWAWIDKVYGIRQRVPKIETRDVQRSVPVSDLVGAAFRDKSAFVRRVAADALIAVRSQVPDDEELIARLEQDRSAAVRSRADFMRRHPMPREA
jgi:hypothetical protein